MEAKSKDESKKFEELARKLQEEKIQKITDKQRKLEEDKLARLKFRDETNKNLRQVKKIRPMYLEQAEKFDHEETQVLFREIASIHRKERVDLDGIKEHMK